MLKRARYFSSMMVVLAILACNLIIPAKTPIPQNIPSKTPTTPTATAEARRTKPPQATSTSTILPPAETRQPTASATARHCFEASLEEEISIPAGAVLTANQAFIKVWRLKNSGSCPWTSAYQLVFVSGDQMSGPKSQSLTSGVVTPGDVVDVSISLVAPGNAGTFRGEWKIREPGGIKFGAGADALRVEIKTGKPAEPSAGAKLPDLYVSEFSIAPTIPIKGQPAHIRVGISNQGGTVATGFTVLWYGLSIFSQPGCSWDVLDGIPPNGGRILECDFVFRSYTPPNKTSLVVVDSGNHVPESNEGNNEGLISPFGVNKP